MSLATRIAQEFNSVRSEAAAQALLENKLAVSASGYTTKVNQEDRWLETSIPNVIVDKVGDDYVIDGVVYEQLGEELVTNGDFSDGANGWSVLSIDNYSFDHTLKVQETTATGKIEQAKSGLAGKTLILEVNILGGDGEFRYNTSSTIWGGGYKSFSGKGSHKFVITMGSNNTLQYGVSCTIGKSIEIDNLSVKELKQATLPLAPFASGSTDELLDDKTYGLTTQVAHNKGDIVVTGNELVTNGTFDTDTDWTKGTGWTISGGVASRTATGTNTGIIQTLSLVIGRVYNISLDINSLSGGNATLYVQGSTISSFSTAGSYTVKYTATTTNTTFSVFGIGNAVVTIDNISVRLADTTYQATRDTANMYDYENDGTSKTVTLNVGDIVYVSDTTPSGGGITGHFYRRITSPLTYDLSTIPSYGSSTSFVDLGTANNMSLQNPYFKVKDFVTRQDLIYLTASGYKTKKGYIDFLDTDFSGKYYSDVIAEKYGFTKLGKGLYEIDGEKVVALQITNQRLNAGAYHPMFNVFGSKFTTNTALTSFVLWSVDSTRITDIYSSFKLNSGKFATDAEDVALKYTFGNTTNRPDKKLFQEIYAAGENGIQNASYFYAKDDFDIEEDRSELGYLESGTVVQYKLQTTTGTVATIEVNDGTKFTATQFVTIYDVTASTLKGRYRVVSINGNTLTIDTAISKSANTYLITGAKHPQLLSSGTRLQIDMIGNPTNYPTSWKSHLASGGVSGINPLLVGDDWTNYLSGINYVGQVKHSKKIKTMYNYARTYDTVEPYTWSSSTANAEIDNTNNLNASTIIDGKYVMSYTAYTSPAVQATPLKVLKVLREVRASNSFSPFKGGLVAGMISGKVAVGNGTNSYESTPLNNALIFHTNISSNTSASLVQNQSTILVLTGYLGTGGVAGKSYKYIGASGTVNLTTATYTDTTKFVDLGYMHPSHNVISLDNSNSSAAKWFECLVEDANGNKGIGIFGKEMAYNSGTTSFDGDNELFDQLTNGTKTDLNGNTVKTFTGVKWL